MRMDRRGALTGMGAMLAAMSISARAAPAPLVKPPRLRAGDMVGLIEPAGFSDDAFDLDLVKETIVAMGLKPKAAPHLAGRYGYLAGTDADRAADVNAMFADPQVRAVFAVRGGWGCARILSRLDFATIRKNPKLLVGFSDITALHLAFAAKAGFTTIHGPNAASSWGAFSWDAFRAVAFDAATPTFTTPVGQEDRLAQRSGRIRTFRPGVARGLLLGGNLTVLAALMGTAYLPDFTGAILFIEDIGEQPYRIDRMLTQLSLAGVLGKLAGVAFGQCTDCGPGGTSYGGFTLSEVLQQHLEPLAIPAFQGGQFGHVANQYSLPLGVEAEMDASAGTIRLLEPAVS
ncbi:LD-carboxypeptidase [Sphingobium sp.]|uniref:S66 peptidase family protein n=1 Tax=Sphingobium TaxID=165695 RepID=UPI001A19E85E|nr:LD-carboxypeptidase [Sphingobium sp.]MBJ7376435.1 LD-carboxypeptidase [Sphingobium sp.]